MLDCAVVNGTVIDGTARPRRRADVGIQNGRVVEISDKVGAAARRIDAEGAVVAPGFVDIHTHYDAQVLWDPMLAPSCYHGVTTVIGGNCGFSVAPIEQRDVDFLIDLFGRVEAIPRSSFELAVDWSWSSFGDFLTRLEGRIGLNAGFLVGHSTVRRLVMGENCHETATNHDVEKMCRLVDDSFRAGALGLSSSLGETHAGAPSLAAAPEELLRLCQTLRDNEGTILEFIPTTAPTFPLDRMELMAEMSLKADSSLNWNLISIRPSVPEQSVENRLSASDVAREKGGAVFGLLMPIPLEMWISFKTGFLLDTITGWADVMTKPPDERLACFKDPATRGRMAACAARDTRSWTDLPNFVVHQTFEPDLRHHEGRSVAEIASQSGSSPVDALFDIVVADRLDTLFKAPASGDDKESWSRRATALSDQRVMVGGSDAGAHADLLASFNYCSSFLGRAVREERIIQLERAVHLLTERPARLYGLTGRGRLAPGYFADLVIFDEDTIGSAPVSLEHDLPGGARRLSAGATGIQWVVVNGVPVVEGGALTGELPGMVIRSARDTQTVRAGEALALAGADWATR